VKKRIIKSLKQKYIDNNIIEKISTKGIP